MGKLLKKDKEGAMEVKEPGPPPTDRNSPKPNLPPKPSSAVKSPSSSPTMEPTNTQQNETRPTKRQKTSEGAGLPTPHAEGTPAQQRFPAASADTANWAPPHRLPASLAHLQPRFNFTSMSILSSSKIEQKVRHLLTRTRLPTTPITPTDAGESKTKAGVVVLCAKGNCIAKMVSVVEIAKRAIQEEGERWFEYCALEGAVTDLKVKEKKGKKETGGKTLRAWQKEQASSAEGEQDVAMEGGGEDLQATGGFKDDEEAAFQTMGRREIMAYDRNPKKIRVVPQMTVYVSRVPVPGLKAVFGEQTNA
ncbi:hypothetical protein G7Y79_00024g055440 [Physcia stellaris]|nr:hypothetical protein G7Y79_00024g055440 [Physcia stellaris]